MEKTILSFNDLIGSFYRQLFALAQKLEKVHQGSIEEFEKRVRAIPLPIATLSLSSGVLDSFLSSLPRSQSDY